MTSYPSIKIDLINAGAEWHDKVVVDRDWLLAEIKMI
jgi:protease I